MVQERFTALPEKTKAAIYALCETYQTSGYECYLVGGSCRDLLMGELPVDFDFATNCPLDITQRLFSKVFSTGFAHGTLTIRLQGHNFEVTRYRKDVETDGRHAKVVFAATLQEDLNRRDLTINAIGYNPLTHSIIDSEGGLQDIEHRKIRFVGAAKKRVQEDHLRAIRYVRMISRFYQRGFRHDPVEFDQVCEVFEDQVLSVERIFEEFRKIFDAKTEKIDFLLESLDRLGVFKRFLPQPSDHRKVIQEVLSTHSLFPLYYRFSTLESLPKAKMVLKISRQEERILQSVHSATRGSFALDVDLKAFLAQIRSEEIEETLLRVDQLLQLNLWKRAKEILERRDPLYIQDLALSGKELQAFGVRGKRVGEVFRFLQKQVWGDPKRNRPDVLTELVVQFLEANNT